ncbi:MAG: hypothetical protein R3C10_26235 [Pirellulales bacterium]
MVFSIPVQVTSAQAKAAAEASRAARELGDPDLAARLGELSFALSKISQNPASNIFHSQAVAVFDSVLSLIQTNAVLSQ